MEPIIDHEDHSSSSSNSSSSKLDERAEVPAEALDLLEESWFFGNLLINPTKPKMMRCFSDPCPSSTSTSTSTSTNEQYSSVRKLVKAEGDGFRRSLVRTPSLPPNIGRNEGEDAREEVDKERCRDIEDERVRKLRTKKEEDPLISKKRNNLLMRTQTLPTSIGIVKVEMNNQHHDGTIIIRKPTRQASLNLADINLPPRHNKGTSRYRAPGNIVVEGIETDGSREMRRRYLNGRNLRRSLSELEIEEVQGFKDLGFTFDNKNMLNPSVVNLLPGLQEKRSEDMDLENKVRRPYLSETWMVQSCAPPPPPNWAATRSSADIKAQIKFWARAIASNARQEC